MVSQVERITGWSWEVHTVASAYRMTPAEVRRMGLWEIHEAAHYILIRQLLEGV